MIVVDSTTLDAAQAFACNANPDPSGFASAAVAFNVTANPDQSGFALQEKIEPTARVINAASCYAES
jgi:hypothetical protein